MGWAACPVPHSASVTSLSTAVGHRRFQQRTLCRDRHPGAIVMTDAAGVRRAAGRHASVLNWLLSDFLDEEQTDQTPPEQPSNLPPEQPSSFEMNIPLPLQELLGHTPCRWWWADCWVSWLPSSTTPSPCRTAVTAGSRKTPRCLFFFYLGVFG
ncbi:MAG: divergent PAP2 family protein [Anaerolineae bacterium]|uniref:divergent PAP2 family protein n=1 Tax=Candidatus Amarolinea dominans TaxID=3140696 RepID=UPI00313703C4|nr:divergent PAP2 family protein [Anaerolineae bacterium]